LLLVGFVAACGGTHAAQRKLGSAQVPTIRRESPAPKIVGPARLVVTVVDGDLNLRVPRAAVSLWGQNARTDATGVAEIVVPHRRGLNVTVDARGFGTRTVWQDFLASRKVTVRVYRPELQWPMYGATATRAQAQTHIKLRPPFRIVWSLGTGDLIEFPAVVDNGVAYIGNARATIHAISMRSGHQLWHHDTPHGQMASSPAVIGSRLVYHTMDGHVIVLDRATGNELWETSVGSPIESSPIVYRGVDYFGAWNGQLYALDLRTHRLRWTRSLGAKITSSAAIDGGRLFIGDYGGRLWALSPRTGATHWVGSVNGRIYGTPAVLDGRVFVPSSTGGSLTAFSTRGRYLWRVNTGSYVYSSPAAWGGGVFFGSYNGVFYGVSASSGRIRWEVGVGGRISGAAVVVDGVAYAGSFAHRIVGVDARNGRVLLRFAHGNYVPVSGNGMYLLFHGYSRLYAVETKRAVTRQTAIHHKRHLRHERK
jgi:outer membrane protein assembly factor BamB